MKQILTMFLIIMMLFVSFGAYASTPTETMAFLGAVNSTTSVSAMKALIDGNVDITKDFDGIYYTDAIYAGLIGRNFTSIKEINDLIVTLTDVEKNNPKIEIKVDGNKASSVGKGVNTVTVAPTLKDGFKLAAATYRDDSLGGADIKDASSSSSVDLSLGEQNGTETSKVMFIKDLNSLKPLSAYDVFYDDAVNVYVSPNGKKTGDGTKENPFGSIEDARDYVRTLIPTMQSDIRVNIAGGTYYITEPIEFTEADGGKNGFDVIYTGNFGENLPLISGGKPVSGWEQTDNTNIYKAHVDGVTDARQFYIDGFSAERAKSSEYFIGEKKYKDVASPVLNEFTVEFESAAAAADHIYTDTKAGETLVGSASASTKPDFSFEFTVPETGYYIPEYIIGSYTAGKHSLVKLYIDDSKISGKYNAGAGNGYVSSSGSNDISGGSQRKKLENYDSKINGTSSDVVMYKYIQPNGWWLTKGTHTLKVEIGSKDDTNFCYKLDKIIFKPEEGLQYKEEDVYSDTTHEPLTFQFEDYATKLVYKDAGTLGATMVGSNWAYNKTNASYLSCNINIPVSGWYDISYKVGAYKSGSYSKIVMSIDDISLGDNASSGVPLDGYSNNCPTAEKTTGSAMHEYTKPEVWLDAGQHVFKAEFSLVGTDHYHYRMDSFSFTRSKVRDGFRISGYDLPDFEHPEDLELISPILWSFHRLPVRDVISLPDEDRHVFIMDQPYYRSYYNLKGDGGQQPTEGMWFYIENAFEYLDEKGEFWFDKENSDIYYYPRNSEELTKEAYIPVSEGLIKVKGTSPESKVSNLTFANLDFRHGAYNELSETGICNNQADNMMFYDKPGTGPSNSGPMPLRQIDINYADNITIENCRLSNLGSAAIGMIKGVTNSTVRKCEINDISGTSIIVGTWNYSSSTPQGELSSDITIENNYIRRIGQELFGSTAVSVYYAKNVDVLHNDIEDTPYSGMTMGWGWGSSIPVTLECGGHSIIGNRFNKTSRLMRDGAAIYTNGSFPESGVVISDNYITDSPDFAGIYMDSGACYITIENNVIDNVVEGVNYNWGRGTARNGAVRNNYVVTDKNALGTTNSEISGTVVVSDRNWPAKAQEIIASAGLSEEIRGIIESYERPQSIKAPYDYLTPVESIRNTDILIEAENYKGGYQDGFNLGWGGGTHVSPTIHTRGKYRKLIASFYGESADTVDKFQGWYRYNLTVPKSGKYRVEFRYAVGDGIGSDTRIMSWATTIKVLDLSAENVISSLDNVRLNDTACASVSSPSVRIGELDLDKGSYILEIRNARGWWQFDNIKLIYIGE